MSKKRMNSPENYKFDCKPAVKDGIYCVTVRIMPEDVSRKRRKDFNNMLKNVFFDRRLYNCHHKIPLHLGGTNDPDNLVLMNKREHNMLHKYIIEPQIKGLMKGQTRDIMLPVMESDTFDFSSDKFAHFLDVYTERYGSYPELRKYMKEIKTKPAKKPVFSEVDVDTLRAKTISEKYRNR